MRFGKQILPIVIAFLFMGCKDKPEPITYLTITPKETLADTLVIPHDTPAIGEYGSKAFHLSIQSEPALSAGNISVTVADSKGVLVPSKDTTLAVSSIPSSGPVAGDVTITVFASAKTVPGIYKVRVSASNGKKGTEIIKIVRVI